MQRSKQPRRWRSRNASYDVSQPRSVCREYGHTTRRATPCLQASLVSSRPLADNTARQICCAGVRHKPLYQMRIIYTAKLCEQQAPLRGRESGPGVERPAGECVSPTPGMSTSSAAGPAPDDPSPDFPRMEVPGGGLGRSGSGQGDGAIQ